MWLFSVISEQIVFWLLKVNNANTRATCEICSKLTIDIRTTSSTFLVETCEVISEVQRKKKQQKKKKNIREAQTPPRAAFYYKVVTYENEIAN